MSTTTRDDVTIIAIVIFIVYTFESNELVVITDYHETNSFCWRDCWHYDFYSVI